MSPPPSPSDSPPATAARTAAEIAAELRRAFDRAVFERYGRAPAQDVVLAALFDTTAVQLARVYEEAEQLFPEAVFDDLVAALGVPPRPAQPAQTVVAFTGAVAPEIVTPDAPLTGLSNRGEHLPFRLVVPLRAGPARLAFAGVVEDGQLHALAGATLPPAPDAPAAAPEPVLPAAASLAPEDAPHAPTLFLAFDLDDADVLDGHLGGLGLFVDLPGPDHPAARALAGSVWQLLGEGGAEGGEAGGVAREPLVLRPRAGPGGTWLLEWADRGWADASPAAADGTAAEDAERAAAGVYGPLCWRWPEVPAARRVRSRAPRAVAAALPGLIGAERAARYERPLAWVQLALPAGTRGVAAAVRRVVAHAAPASNVEALGVVVDVGALGASGVFPTEAVPGRHLGGVLGVTGEHGLDYGVEADPAAALARGRYRVRAGVVELTPARGPTGRFDRTVLVRLLYTDGERANALRPGQVVARGTRGWHVGFGAASVVPARGGTAPPGHGPARVRFADVVRTRERVVTPADVDVAMRALEPRVLDVSLREVVEVDAGARPRRVGVVTALVRAGDFQDPEAELPVLAGALARHLRARAAAGMALRVEVRDDGRGGGAAVDAVTGRVRAAVALPAPESASPPASPPEAEHPVPSAPRRMPDLVRPRRGARHTVDTALRALRLLGVGDARVAVESAGPGWAEGAVVRQHPAPGARLDGPGGGAGRVALGVAGPGALESLPYALRDVPDGPGGDDAFGVDALMALFDSPTHKLRHHVRAGGEFYALRADDPLTARRWLEQVFHVDPTPWRPARWPALVRLLAALHRTAGREAELAPALDRVLGLPLAAVALERAVVPAAPNAQAALGVRAARLGVDALLGAGRLDVARLALTFGPVSLATYRAQAAPARAAERRALYALLVPTSLAADVQERWIVGDPGAGTRFGEGAVALGLTTRLAASSA